MRYKIYYEVDIETDNDEDNINVIARTIRDQIAKINNVKQIKYNKIKEPAQ